MVRPTLLAFLYFYRTFSDLFRLPDARPLASWDLRVSSNSFFSSSLPNSDASTSRPSPRFFCSLSHPLSLLQIQAFRSQAQDHPRRVSFSPRSLDFWALDADDVFPHRPFMQVRRNPSARRDVFGPWPTVRNGRFRRKEHVDRPPFTFVPAVDRDAPPS